MQTFCYNSRDVMRVSCRGGDGPVKNRGVKQSVLKEVRAWPPTPQKIPSPSSRRLRSTKPASSGTTSSPLNKPPKSAPKVNSATLLIVN